MLGSDVSHHNVAIVLLVQLLVGLADVWVSAEVALGGYFIGIFFGKDVLDELKLGVNICWTNVSVNDTD